MVKSIHSYRGAKINSQHQHYMTQPSVTPGDPTLPSGSLEYLHSSAQTDIKTYIHMIKNIFQFIRKEKCGVSCSGAAQFQSSNLKIHLIELIFSSQTLSTFPQKTVQGAPRKISQQRTPRKSHPLARKIIDF